MKRTLLAAILAFAGFSAHAVTLELTPGNYMESYSDYLYGEMKGRFEIRQKGPQIRLIDTVAEIVYGLDLNNTGEQKLPQKYIEFLRGNTLIGSVRSTIEDVTVKVLGQGKTKDEINGVVYVYQKFNIAKTEVKIKWAFEMNVNAYNKDFMRYDQGQNVTVNLPIIAVRSTKIYIANMKTIFPESTNRYFAQVITKLVNYMTDTGPLVKTALRATK